MDAVRGFSKRNRAAIGYLLLVVVVLFALELHHDATEADIRETAVVACENARTLTANQEFVLRTMRALLLEEAREHDSHPHITEALRELNERVAALPTYDCEEE